IGRDQADRSLPHEWFRRRRPKATQTLIAEHKTLRTLSGQAYNNGPYTSSTGTN
ncbi:hypothetical protein Pmar_PMAR024257, partial [Perkinsus marinus ATCC 50983]